MPNWKESGLERIGWGAYPHVLLKHFLTMDGDWNLRDVERLALRILIVYGEVTEPFLTERLQKAYPIGKKLEERTISTIFQIKESLRTFYSLDIENNFKKFTLVYNIGSDPKQKREAGKLKKLRLELIEMVEKDATY